MNEALSAEDGSILLLDDELGFIQLGINGTGHCFDNTSEPNMQGRVRLELTTFPDVELQSIAFFVRCNKNP